MIRVDKIVKKFDIDNNRLILMIVINDNKYFEKIFNNDIFRRFLILLII